jgi:hypothetical protein
MQSVSRTTSSGTYYEVEVQSCHYLQKLLCFCFRFLGTYIRKLKIIKKNTKMWRRVVQQRCSQTSWRNVLFPSSGQNTKPSNQQDATAEASGPQRILNSTVIVVSSPEPTQFSCPVFCSLLWSPLWHWKRSSSETSANFLYRTKCCYNAQDCILHGYGDEHIKSKRVL